MYRDEDRAPRLLGTGGGFIYVVDLDQITYFETPPNNGINPPEADELQTDICSSPVGSETVRTYLYC